MMARVRDGLASAQILMNVVPQVRPGFFEKLPDFGRNVGAIINRTKSFVTSNSANRRPRKWLLQLVGHRIPTVVLVRLAWLSGCTGQLMQLIAVHTE